MVSIVGEEELEGIVVTREAPLLPTALASVHSGGIFIDYVVHWINCWIH